MKPFTDGAPGEIMHRRKNTGVSPLRITKTEA
jgi:hypothetical protein